jgi:putative ABC transport system permease protein
MWTLWRMALRNLGRRRARTALTASMIAGGTALAVLSLGMNFGTYDHMIDLATRSSVGHVQAVAEGYVDTPKLNRTLADADAARAALAGHVDVVAVTPRVEAGGLFALGNRTVGGMLVGVDAAGEGAVTSVPSNLGKGDWLPAEVGPDDPLPVVVDAGLLQQLRGGLGAEISYVSQAADGSMAAELFVVVGVTKLTGLGAATAYVRIEDARTTLALGDRTHRLVGRVDSLRHVDDVVDEVAAPPGDVVVGWETLVPNLARSIESDKAGGWIYLGIVMVVVLLGVANTMLMSVFERKHEFGVLMALGTRPRQIVLVTLAEAFWLSLGAVAVGGALGHLGNLLVGREGIPLGDAAMEYGGVVIDRMIAVNTAWGTVGVPAVVLVCGVLASALPAWRASRLNPTEALRP